MVQARSSRPHRALRVGISWPAPHGGNDPPRRWQGSVTEIRRSCSLVLNRSRDARSRSRPCAAAYPSRRPDAYVRGRASPARRAPCGRIPASHSARHGPPARIDAAKNRVPLVGTTSRAEIPLSDGCTTKGIADHLAGHGRVLVAGQEKMSKSALGRCGRRRFHASRGQRSAALARCALDRVID